MQIKKIKLKYIVVFIFVLLITYGFWKKIVLSNNARYTIGVTGETFWTVSEGIQIKYSYFINGTQYSKEEDYTNFKIKNGCKCRYYVKYDYKNPSHSKLLQNRPVPDSIKYAPLQGWDRIPGE